MTHVAALDDKARVEELAQMLGASGDGAIKSAKEILKNVAEEKKVSTLTLYVLRRDVGALESGTSRGAGAH